MLLELCLPLQFRRRQNSCGDHVHDPPALLLGMCFFPPISTAYPAVCSSSYFFRFVLLHISKIPSILANLVLFVAYQRTTPKREQGVRRTSMQRFSCLRHTDSSFSEICPLSCILPARNRSISPVRLYFFTGAVENGATEQQSSVYRCRERKSSPLPRCV